MQSHYTTDSGNPRPHRATSTVSYRRAPVRELRGLPVRHNPRLQVLDYRLTDAPGMTGGKPRTHGHGSALLAGGFVMALCLTRDQGEWFLEVERAPFDEALGRRSLALTPQLLADLYRAVQARQIAGEGRCHMSGAGRN